MSDHAALSWSDDIEEVLESIRNNSYVMSNHHKKLYWSYKGQLKYYRIPVIIISGINSVVAVGLQPYLDQGLISATNCLLALFVGIIGSIELFLGLQDSMETELMGSKNFYLLAIDIYKTLTLDRSRRNCLGKDYLEEKYGEYTKLYGNAQMLRSKIKDKLSNVPGSTMTEDTDLSSTGSIKKKTNVKSFNIENFDSNNPPSVISLDQLRSSQPLQSPLDQLRSSPPDLPVIQETDPEDLDV